MPYRTVFAGIVIVAAFLPVSGASAAGALALDRGGGAVWYGVNSDSGTLEEAQARAMEACSQHGACGIETTFWNKCFAFAWQGSGHDGYGWATRDSLGAAERAAIRACESHGRPCVLQDSRCDTTGR